MLTTLPLFIVFAIVSNGVLFVVLGGALHHAFYVRRADRAHEWRVQPDKPLPTREEMRAKLRAVVPNLVLFNAVVGAALWAIANGYSQVVFDTQRYGAPLLVVTGLLLPVTFHLLAFALHRAYHEPFLFKHIHWVHHKARTPVFIDGLGMHKIEVVTSALTLVAPAFILPTHIAAFALYMTAVGIHELLDHSGIKMRLWPMSPSQHHDEHHRAVKRCYAQTFTFLDDVLGTGMPSARDE